MEFEASAAAEIFKVSVVMFTKEKAYVLNRKGAKGTIFLKFHMKHWTELLREDMPEKVTAAKNVPALSSEQREHIDKLANADTKGMRGTAMSGPGSQLEKRSRTTRTWRKCYENEES